MAETTGIGWTDATFNSHIGCTEAGPGCDLCYARELDRRYKWGVPAVERVKGGPAPHWGPGAPRYRTSAGYWKGPVLWNAGAERRGVPLKVFCNSLSDVFDNEVPQAWRDDLFDLWAKTPWLRWQVVTKRIGNAPKMLKDELPPNVGLIVTTVNQDEFDRDAPKLFAVPATWHGFSIEPQIGRVLPFTPNLMHAGPVWIITGGESRQAGVLDVDGKPVEPRPYHLDWPKYLMEVRRLCPNVSVFVKQTGAKPAGLDAPTDGAGADPSKWPDWLRVQQFVPELMR